MSSSQLDHSMGWWDIVLEAGKLVLGAQELWAGSAYWVAIGRHQSKHWGKAWRNEHSLQVIFTKGKGK